MDAIKFDAGHVHYPTWAEEPDDAIDAVTDASDGEWKTVTKAHGGGYNSGPWCKEPCIAITQAGITLNKCFVDSFFPDAKANHLSIIVQYNKATRQLRLKVPGTQDSMMDMYALGRHGKNVAFRVQMPEIAKKFPECVDRLFVADVPFEARVVTVDLGIHD